MASPVRILNPFLSFLETFYKYSALCFITLCAILGISKVLVRYLPIPGSYVIAEFTIVAFIWAVLMAIAWQVNKEGHMVVSVFYDMMPLRLKRALSILFLTTILLVGLVMVYYGILYIYQTRTVRFTSLGYPRWIAFYLPLPISGFGVAVFAMSKLLPFIRLHPK